MNRITILLFGLVLAVSCAEKASEQSAEAQKTSNRPLAKFEPEEGKVLLFVGQELNAIGGLPEYTNGYMDHYDRPAGWTRNSARPFSAILQPTGISSSGDAPSHPPSQSAN